MIFRRLTLSLVLLNVASCSPYHPPPAARHGIEVPRPLSDADRSQRDKEATQALKRLHPKIMTDADIDKMGIEIIPRRDITFDIIERRKSATVRIRLKGWKFEGCGNGFHSQEKIMEVTIGPIGGRRDQNGGARDLEFEKLPTQKLVVHFERKNGQIETLPGEGDTLTAKMSTKSTLQGAIRPQKR